MALVSSSTYEALRAGRRTEFAGGLLKQAAGPLTVFIAFPVVRERRPPWLLSL